MSFPDAMDAREKKALQNRSKNYFIKEGILWRRKKWDEVPVRVLWDKNQIAEVLRMLHEENGHKGVATTFAAVRSRYYWLNFYLDVKEYVESCVVCQMMNTKTYEEPLHSISMMTVHRYWFVDVQKLPKSEGGYIGIIEAREGLTGWVEASMIKSMKSEVWVKFIYENILCRYGVVGTIISDNGELNSKLGLEFADKYGVQLIFTTTYHPQGNAPVERGHLPLRRSIERSVFGNVSDWLNFDKDEEKTKWPLYFHAALWADRVSVRRQLGFSPYYLLSWKLLVGIFRSGRIL